MENQRFEIDPREGETVGDVAYRRIRADLVNGKLKPLDRLRLEVLRDAYDVSISTLREILGKLAVEELITAEGQRGFRVAPISVSDLTGLGELRILLETHALRRSLALGDLEWQGQVVAAHYTLSVLEKDLLSGSEGAVEKWVRHDWGFHRACIAACDSAPLMRTHASIFDRYARYHTLILDFRGKAAAQEHERLRDLVLSRDADAAVDLLTSHIRSGVAHIVATGKVPA